MTRPVAAPRLDATAGPLLAVRQLRIQHRLPRAHPFARPRYLRAVDELNFNLHAGETLALVGESGSGKSTLARALLGVQPVSSGSIRFDGHELVGLDRRGWQPLRRQIQMVFQDPQGSLDPRMRVAQIVAEPLVYLCPELDAAERRHRVEQTLERVGLGPEMLECYPRQLSGGQCQRVGIARALVCGPRLLICDEAVAALDAVTQAQVLQLLREIQMQTGMAMLFITHDLAIARQISDRVLVMYYGRLMEQAPTRTLFAAPRHPYTRALLASVPGVDPAQRAALLRPGAAPDTSVPSTGCLFAARCPMADEQCLRRVPPVHRLRDGSAVACHYIAEAWVPPTKAA
ncbi:oligopeptide transport system ATP-binding protein [Fontimonas thermophila]|uniref:Oligopeptide transport system ATP-binding protein n=1 Tax=Fontimonas thermophila TaxID=1076937 RepID=A0A1I2JVE6_9GAMM|nr:ABC transporter ATP-binding protein [Fontimonas thermophila]SFF58149.1 oligopeptide transport system ATP-binding protein [Fontimonas thermophila]